MGFTLANVIGVPIGTMIGHSFGWRASFWFVVILGIINYIFMLIVIPNVKSYVKASIKNELRSLLRPLVLMSFLVIIVSYTGFHMVVTYLAPMFVDITGFDIKYISIILFILGTGFTIGSIIGGNWADKNLEKTLIITLSIFAFATLLLSFTIFSKIWAVVTLGLWGFFIFAAVPAMQLKSIKSAEGAPNMASSMALGAYNVGIAGGSFFGGKLLSNGLSLDSLPVFAAIIIFVSVFISIVLLKMTKK
jgi:DHA1 family inner membrane transport protein